MVMVTHMQRELPTRKGIRIKGYDYSSAGYYFVTICVKDKHDILWEEAGTVGARITRPLSDAGKTVKTAIETIPKIYAAADVVKYVIMPNHIHMIIVLQNDESGRVMRTPTISTVINQMKGYVTKQLGYSLWQKLFYDEIIKSEKAYQRIWQYIDENPARWAEDDYYSGPTA